MTPAQQDAYDKAQVMLAFARGEEMQSRNHIGGTWNDWNCKEGIPWCTWNWQDADFRIKPKPREWWGVVIPNDERLFNTRDEAERSMKDWKVGVVKPIVVRITDP